MTRRCDADERHLLDLMIVGKMSYIFQNAILLKSINAKYPENT
jgi:hypothetical protein